MMVITKTKVIKSSMVNEQKTIQAALRDLMADKNLSAQKLSDLTDVPTRFVDAIIKGDFNKLPAKPYIRGYLFKIANSLDVENDDLWRAYRFSTETASSGESDMLPGNRFALKKISPSKVIGLIVALLVIIFFIVRFDRIVGSPDIRVVTPEIVSEEITTISGDMDPDDRLTINGELIYVTDDGSFSKDVRLEAGINTFQIVATRKLGRQTEITRQIIYEPKEEPEEIVPVEEVENTNNIEENGQN